MPPLRMDRTRSRRKKRYPKACGLWVFAAPPGSRFVYAVPLFVGEAYMPPGRGLPPRGVYGKYGRSPCSAGQTPYPPYPGGRRVHYTTSPIFERPQAAILSALRAAFGGCAPRRACGRSTTIFHFYFFIFHFPRLFLRCFFNNVPHSNSRRFAGRRGGRITAIPGEVGFAGGAAVSAPPRHFPCPHKAAAAVRVYVLLAGRTPARLNPSGAASVAAPGGLLIQQSRRWQKPGSPPGRRRPGPAPRR